MIPPDRVRPYLEPIPPYNGQLTPAITIYERNGTTQRYSGEFAVRTYRELYDGPGAALVHGTHKSPLEIGVTLTPQPNWASDVRSVTLFQCRLSLCGADIGVQHVLENCLQKPL